MMREPVKPYIYQPYGMQDKEQWATKHIYAVVDETGTLKGLTKDAAEKIMLILKKDSESASEKWYDRIVK